MTTPVAVTGIGVVSAFGHGVQAFWDGLVAGRTGLRPLERLGGVQGAEVPPLALRTVARSPLARRMDRTSLLALAACRFALVDAGLDDPLPDPARTGLALASALGNVSETVGFLDRLHERGTGNPLLFPNLVMNAPLSYAAIELGVTGPTAMLTEQEASGEAAIAWGAEQVAKGAVDLCLAGAADELDPVLVEVLRAAGTIASGPPRPLHPAADGSAPGEGAAVLVLEPLEGARSRGARIYARLVPHAGFGVPAPVHGWPGDPEPLARGLGPLVADADLVVAAASGDPVLDALERAALLRALAGRRALVTAPRGATGHFGSAGALAVAVAALAVAHNLVPPTLGAAEGGHDGLAVVAGRARDATVGVAVVDGLARGGACRPLRLEAI